MSVILQSEQQIALAGFEPAGNFTASWHTNVWLKNVAVPQGGYVFLAGC